MEISAPSSRRPYRVLWVDPLTKGLAGADDPSLLPDGIDGFFSGAVHGGTVQKRRQNVKSADFF